MGLVKFGLASRQLDPPGRMVGSTKSFVSTSPMAAAQQGPRCAVHPSSRLVCAQTRSTMRVLHAQHNTFRGKIHQEIKR